MPMWKISTSSGNSSGDDGGCERRQQDHLGDLLAEQVVVNELARGSNPERTSLMLAVLLEDLVRDDLGLVYVSRRCPPP